MCIAGAYASSSSSVSTTLHSPISTLFPYTTLFRSFFRFSDAPQRQRIFERVQRRNRAAAFLHANGDGAPMVAARVFVHVAGERRSEEHTSELQSREKLVCRLLLEKKKTSASSETST